MGTNTVHINKNEWPCYLSHQPYMIETDSLKCWTLPTLTMLIAQKDFGYNNNCIRNKQKKKLLLLCLIHTDNNTSQCENDI